MFLATAITVLSGLSPDIRSYSYLESFSDSKVAANQPMFGNEESNLELYYLKEDEEDLLKNVSKYLQHENVNESVQQNTIKVIENLSKIFIENIENDNVYTSNYGTILIDFEKNDNIFSLEIGSKSIGYFSEINDVTNDFCEESFIDNDKDFNISIGRLNSDFINFHNKI